METGNSTTTGSLDLTLNSNWDWEYNNNNNTWRRSLSSNHQQDNNNNNDVLDLFLSDGVLLFFDAFGTFFSVFCSITGILGCVTNTLNMAVFAHIGLNESINVSFFGISLSDFVSGVMLALFAVSGSSSVARVFEQFWSVLLLEIADVAFFNTLIIFMHITMVITALVAFERCLCVTVPMKVKLLITPTKIKVGVTTVFVTAIVLYSPVYFAYPFQWSYNSIKNKTLFGLGYSEEAERILTSVLPVALFGQLAVYLLIVICTSVLMIALKMKLEWRKTVTSAVAVGVSKKTPNNDDSVSVSVSTETNVPKVGSPKSSKETNAVKIASSKISKETKVAKVVLFISALFICCSLPNFCLSGMMLGMVELRVTDDELTGYNALYNFVVRLTLVGHGVNISMNLFIFYRTSSKYSAAFNQIFHFHKKFTTV